MMFLLCIYSVESNQDQEETGVSKPLTGSVTGIMTVLNA